MQLRADNARLKAHVNRYRKFIEQLQGGGVFDNVNASSSVDLKIRVDQARRSMGQGPLSMLGERDKKDEELDRIQHEMYRAGDLESMERMAKELKANRQEQPSGKGLLGRLRRVADNVVQKQAVALSFGMPRAPLIVEMGKFQRLNAGLQ